MYRRRRAVERTLASGPELPADLVPAWQDLLASLVRLHQAVDWSGFNAWYLERDGC